MPHLTPSVRRILVVLLGGTLGCGSDLTLPDTNGSGETIVAFTAVTGEQSGRVGEPLFEPLIVKVLGAGDEPAVGMQVAFELSDASAGTVDPDTATTNSQGEAVAHWTLGTVPGSYTVVARLVGAEAEARTAEFTAAAGPAAPDTLSPQVPLNQPGRRQQQVQEAPMVRVVDRFGNPVPNEPVAWQVIAGEGAVASPITTTDAEGKTSVDWTLGNRIGVHKLTATIGSVTGSPVTFTAVVYF
ncbi:MAG TPA: Ig-like domain-containing protein [Gemmatimonadales bacterium]